MRSALPTLALGRHSRRATDPERLFSCWKCLGNAYLRLGQIVKAEQCVAAMLAPPDLHGSISCCLGEIKLWSIVRQHPGFRGQLLLSDELVRHPAAAREDLVTRRTRPPISMRDPIFCSRGHWHGAVRTLVW